MLPSHSVYHGSGDLVSLTLTILADSGVNVSILPLDLSHPDASLLPLCSIPILTATVPTAPPLHPLSHFFSHRTLRMRQPRPAHRDRVKLASPRIAQPASGLTATTRPADNDGADWVVEVSTAEVAGVVEEEEEEAKAQQDDLPFDVTDMLTRIDKLAPSTQRLPIHSHAAAVIETEHKEAPALTTGDLHTVAIDIYASSDTTLTSTPSLSSVVFSSSPPAAPSPLAASSAARVTRAMAWDVALLQTLYRHLVLRMLEYKQHDEDWQMMEERRVALQLRIDELRKQQQPSHTVRSRSPSSLELPPRSFLSASSDGLPSFHCPICLSDCPSYAGVSLSGCAHFVCSSCLTDYLSSSIMQGNVSIHCPCMSANSRPCPTVLPSTIILAYTPTAIYQHYVRICALKRDGTLRNCPRCDHQQKGNRISSRLTCAACQFKYCYHHSNAHPPTQSCRSYMRAQSAANKESMRVIAATTVRCPSCSAPVEKESGCNHMQCTQCECEFCFLCGARYACGLHFWEWNLLTGCPGMQHTPGMAGERRTVSRLMWRALCGWPLTCLLVPTAVLLLIALFFLVEGLWLGLFLLSCPVFLALHCCCAGWQSGWSWDARERFHWWLWLGPRILMHICPCHCCGDM